MYQAKLDPVIHCADPPVTLARRLWALFDKVLSKENGRGPGPPIVRDTVSDEQGMYFRRPVEVEQADGVFILHIKATVWTWDSERYEPENYLVDVLDVEIMPSGNGGSEIAVVPAFDLRGFEEHAGELLRRVCVQISEETARDIPQPADEPSDAHHQDPFTALGAELGRRLSDAADQLSESAGKLAQAMIEEISAHPQYAGPGPARGKLAQAMIKEISAPSPTTPVDESRPRPAEGETDATAPVFRPHRSEVIHGTVDHFRALMERLALRHRKDGWASTSGERLGFWEERKKSRELARGTWRVSQRGDNGSAGIEAYGQPGYTVRLDFLDGYAPGLAVANDFPPIGPAFDEFTQMVIEEVRGMVKPIPDASLKDNSVSIYFRREAEEPIAADTVEAMDDPLGGRYGTCRDLTGDDVREIVKRCRNFQKRGGKVTDFYRYQKFSPDREEPRSYALETLRGWLKDSRFQPEDT